MKNIMGRVLAIVAGTLIIFSSIGIDRVHGATTPEKAEAESCVKPAGGPITPTTVAQPAAASEQRGVLPAARVGKPAPDFEATAYQNGKFRNLKMSDYRGKWLVLCFYPGDFTFV